jgi:L-threonylcarbamoyladenylate synthase
MTKYWNLEAMNEEAVRQVLEEAAALLREGNIVAFPTETVYGLGADARSTPAVERIFRAKGRPSDNPLIVHIADFAQLKALVHPISPLAQRLMDCFWPGPLTLVLPAREGAVSPRVTVGLPTLAVRMPGHPLALRLIAAAGCPVAAPSANRSGRPSPTRAVHVREDLNGLIDGLIDGGATGVGLESTVVEVDGGRLHVLRPGGVSLDELRAVAGPGNVTVDEVLLCRENPAADELMPVYDPGEPNPSSAGCTSTYDSPAGPAPKSPGMKYRHYAPRGAMTIISTASGTTGEQAAAWMQVRLDDARAAGERTGVLTYEEHAGCFRADLVIACGSLRNLETAAHELYGALRRFDEEDITYILAEACPEEGIGFAVMNRLSKAAGNRMIRI